MCYAALALVTDMDAGAESGEGVGQEEVFALFKANLERLTSLLTAAVGALPDPDGCALLDAGPRASTLTYDVPDPAPDPSVTHSARRPGRPSVPGMRPRTLTVLRRRRPRRSCSPPAAPGTPPAR